jgi:hypothetical protein
VNATGNGIGTGGLIGTLFQRAESPGMGGPNPSNCSHLQEEAAGGFTKANSIEMKRNRVYSTSVSGFTGTGGLIGQLYNFTGYTLTLDDNMVGNPYGSTTTLNLQNAASAGANLGGLLGVVSGGACVNNTSTVHASITGNFTGNNLCGISGNMACTNNASYWNSTLASSVSRDRGSAVGNTQGKTATNLSDSNTTNYDALFSTYNSTFWSLSYGAYPTLK